MTIFVPQPDGLTWLTWADAFAGYNPTLDDVPRPPPETAWQEWGQSLALLPTLSGSTVPDPTFFASWQDWAARLKLDLDGYS